MPGYGRLEDRFLVGALERRIGYRFAEPGLLLRAVTHPSYAQEGGSGHYERLETLGDAVLSHLVVRALYDRLPEASPGELTVLRARVVSGRSLSRIARSLDLPALLRVAPEAELAVRGNDAALEDALEAIVGAVSLDGGMPAAEALFARIFGAALAAAIDGEDEEVDWKSRLQDFSQRSYGQIPEYRVVSESGSPHRKTFLVEVRVAGEAFGRGEGTSKRAAEREAARDALEPRPQR